MLLKSPRRLGTSRLRAALLAAALPLSLVFASGAKADVKLPNVLGDHMVLQQGQPVPVWGWADAGEEVTVTFAGQTLKTKAGDDKKWSVKLAPLTASDQGAELTVAGKNTIKLADILVGEVWVCSGQSNMEWSVNASKDKEKEIAAANHPTIRLFDVPNTTAETPLSDINAKWVACSPQTIGGFSAVAYYFGRELNQQLKVPIGLVHTSWGGTRAEAWTSAEYLNNSEDFKGIVQPPEVRQANYEKAKAAYEKARAEHALKADEAKKANKPAPQAPRAPQPPGKNPNDAATLYNGMIAPIVPVAIKGAIWYQGESNAGKAYLYRKLLPLMIQNWRDVWAAGGADKDFKFLIVQLANYQKPADKPGDDAWAELREAQMMTGVQPNNGIASAIDLADADNPGDIHPKNKQDVGKRLALSALAQYYGKTDVAYSGPLYTSHQIEDGKVRLSFKHADGLAAKGDKITGFQIAGEDKKWVWADAKIDGKDVIVSSPDVAKPAAIRYAWSQNPQVNLYNAAGLPMWSFRTDDWPGVTAKNK